LCDSLIMGDRASGVIVATEGKQVEFIPYEFIKKRKKP
jgi:hypothetical protein